MNSGFYGENIGNKEGSQHFPLANHSAQNSPIKATVHVMRKKQRDFFEDSNPPTNEMEGNTGIHEDLTPSHLVAEKGKNLSLSGPLMRENCIGEFTGSHYPAQKEITNDFVQNPDAPKSNMEALKEGGRNHKSGNFYMGQCNHIKERMEWSLVEGIKESSEPLSHEAAPMSKAGEHVAITQPTGLCKKTSSGSSKRRRSLGKARALTIGPNPQAGDKKEDM